MLLHFINGNCVFFICRYDEELAAQEALTQDAKGKAARTSKKPSTWK